MVKKIGSKLSEKSSQVFCLQLHLTDKCDQRCKHCYVWTSGNCKKESHELTLHDYKNIIDRFIKFCILINRRPELAITGGDPLLYKDVWGFLEYLKEKKISFYMAGNPYHLSPEVCTRLYSLGCNIFQLSLDGLEETHDFLRKKGSFKTTVSKISELNNAGIKTGIMATVSRLNSMEMPELARLVSKLNASFFVFARYVPTHGDGEYTFTPKEYKNFLATMWEAYKKLVKETSTIFVLRDSLWKLFLYENGLFKAAKGDLVSGGCNIGISKLTMLPDGNVYACRRFESFVGNILKEDFEDIFFGKKMDVYRDIDAFEGCKDCELLNYCRGCHAVSAATFGNFFKKDPQCWMKTESST